MDRYLAGWAARLLSPAGRLVLIDAVLDALPTYAMAALLLPPAVVRALDGLRRAFLWNVAERASGAQCLVAWERVCRAKSEGGLGIRDLATQNLCLLLKMLHRLHSSESRWASWVWAELNGRSLLHPGSCRRARAHGRSLRGMLPLYCAMSRVRVQDGRRTSFWLDWWLPCGPLSVAFPALYSHTTSAEATVFYVWNGGLDRIFVPRHTRPGTHKQKSLLTILPDAPVAPGVDERMLPLCGRPRSGGLVARHAYALLRYGGRLSPHAAFVWGTRAPSRVKFFCWLLVHRRVNTRDALLRKTIVDRAGAGCPVCLAELETAAHLMFVCPFAREFWRVVGGVVITAGASVERLFALDVRVAVGDASPDTFILLCCWHLWKHRNGVVFQAMVPSLDRVLSCCREDAVLWRERLRPRDRADVDAWVRALTP